METTSVTYTALIFWENYFIIKKYEIISTVYKNTKRGAKR